MCVSDPRYLKAFDGSDLSKYFNKYSVEKSVQRRIRSLGFNKVEDLLALTEIEFQEYLCQENQHTQDASLKFFKLIFTERAKIVDRNQRGAQSQPSTPAPAPPHASPAISATPLATQPNETAATHEEEDALVDLPPIKLGTIRVQDMFHTEKPGGFQQLSFDEHGLRRHLLIAGSTGSGKTVAARYIIEQAAIVGVPSIVIDAQGDISSLVLQASNSDASVLYETAAALSAPQSPKEDKDLHDRIEDHRKALNKHPGPIISLYKSNCLPRIFTPGRPELGLSLALPPYLDILGAYGQPTDEIEQHELDEFLSDEVRNLLHSIPLQTNRETMEAYAELLFRLFRYAHEQNISLEGHLGIQNLYKLVCQAPEIYPNLFSGYLSQRDHQKVINAVHSLQFHHHEKWHEGHSFDVRAIIQPGVNGRTPINILNVQELSNDDDRKRVLRQVIAAVYKYAVQNPRLSGPPSLILYIDEIGTGYGERSVAKPDKSAKYAVYGVLNRLVRQARKYGISVILASQAYTDFYPDIRRQLGTKIIGKVDDRSEQQRVSQSIGDDLMEGGRDPRQFVQDELPRLGPPRLLYVSNRGDADTYDQFKCCTLDVTLKARDLRRWREAYERQALEGINSAQELFDRNQYNDALQQLDNLSHEVRFLKVSPSVNVLQGRCLVRLNRPEDAETLLPSVADEDASRDYLDLGREIAQSYHENGLLQRYETVLKRTIGLAQRLDPPLHEQLQLEFSKYHLFQDRDPQAVAESLEAISNSEDPQVSLFARAWNKAVQVFRNWVTVWDFFTQDGKTETSIIEPNHEPFSISITALPKEEAAAKVPDRYTTELVTKPEILKISKLTPLSSSEEGIGSRSVDSLVDLSSLASQQQTHIEQFRLHKQEGHIREAIQELEAYFRQPAITQPDESTRQEIIGYELEPNVRKARIADWLESLDWRRFEREVAVLFTQMDYKAWATKPTGDGGVDVRAIKGDDKVVIQCKHWKSQKVGPDPIKALHATKEHEGASRAIFVTSSELEPVANRSANQLGVEVIQGVELIGLFEKYCGSPQPSANNVSITPTPPSKPAPNMYYKPSATPPKLFPEIEHFLDSKDRQILQLVYERKQIRNKDIQDLLHLSRPGVSARLAKLTRLNYLVMHGTKAIAFYTQGPRTEQ